MDTNPVGQWESIQHFNGFYYVPRGLFMLDFFQINRRGNCASGNYTNYYATLYGRIFTFYCKLSHRFCYDGVGGIIACDPR